MRYKSRSASLQPQSSSEETRKALILYLKEHGVHAVFHYLSLHNSPFYVEKHDGRMLPNSDRFSECLVRLPLFYELQETQVVEICQLIERFFIRKEIIE